MTFRGRTGTPHNVVAEWLTTQERIFRCAADCEVDGSGGDPSQETWVYSHVFDQPGEILFYSEPFRDQGMTGRLTVLGAEEGIPVNLGHAGSWYNPATNGQGFLVEVLVDDEGEPVTVIVYWFAWDLAQQSAQADSKFAGAEQRWFVAAGPIVDGIAEMDLTLTTGGVFDDPAATETVTVGSLRFIPSTCMEGQFIYDISQNVTVGDNVSGVIDAVRLTPDVLCEDLIATGE